MRRSEIPPPTDFVSPSSPRLMRSTATTTLAAAATGRRSNQTPNGERSLPSRYSTISTVMIVTYTVPIGQRWGQNLKYMRVAADSVEVVSRFLAIDEVIVGFTSRPSRASSSHGRHRDSLAGVGIAPHGRFRHRSAASIVARPTPNIFLAISSSSGTDPSRWMVRCVCV